VQVQPEELVALQPGGDALLVDLGQHLHVGMGTYLEEGVISPTET